MDSILEVPIRVNSEGEIEVQVMPRLDENGRSEEHTSELQSQR